jgi:predicted nuclease of predicted toxin-antitoxin system
MRLLIDSCVAAAVIRGLRQAGFDVEAVIEWNGDPGDRAILRYAQGVGRILVTRDKDFGELIFKDGEPHSGLLRIAGEMNYAEQLDRALAALRAHAVDLDRYAIVTVDFERIRVSGTSAKEN